MKNNEYGGWRMIIFWTSIALATLIFGFVLGWVWRDRTGSLSSVRWIDAMTAVGTMAAVIVALWLAAYQKDVAENARRREPLWALRAIIDHSQHLIRDVPNSGLSTYLVELYFSGTKTIDSFKTAESALASFPIDKLLDYSAIQSVFEMQEALSEMRSAVEGVVACRTDWIDRWYDSKSLIQQAQTRADLALTHLQVALDGARAS